LRDIGDEPDRGGRPVLFPFLEISFDAPHLIGDVSKARDRSGSCLGKCVKPRHFFSSAVGMIAACTQGRMPAIGRFQTFGLDVWNRWKAVSQTWQQTFRNRLSSRLKPARGALEKYPETATFRTSSKGESRHSPGGPSEELSLSQASTAGRSVSS
jgi:hypothetical protein